MEHTDIFKQIIETEQRAKVRREEAVKRQAELEGYLKEKQAELRSESYLKADAEIAAEEEKYRAAVDAEIEKLKAKQEQDIKNINLSFDKKLNEWLDKLFQNVVGNV